LRQRDEALSQLAATEQSLREELATLARERDSLAEEKRALLQLPRLRPVQVAPPILPPQQHS
jgi:cell division protein FtsB